MEDPKCEECGWPLHRYRALRLCDECEQRAVSDIEAGR